MNRSQKIGKEEKGTCLKGSGQKMHSAFEEFTEFNRAGL